MNDFTEQFNRLLGQLDDDEAAELRVKPWLAVCVKDGETTLELARERWINIQDAVQLHLRAEGIEVRQRVRGSDGMMTTALKTTTDDEVAGAVKVHVDDAAWEGQ